MASSMPSSSARGERPAARRRRWLALAVLLASTAAAAYGLQVRAVRLTTVNDIVNVTAALDLELSDDAREALEHGVDLVFEIDSELRQRRRWIWDTRLARIRRHLVLQRHALSRQYVVDQPESGQRRVFTRLDRALAALGEVGPWPLVDRRLLDPGGRYVVRVRARLDREALPGPLQLIAWVTPGWRLSSGWQQVELTP